MKILRKHGNIGKGKLTQGTHSSIGSTVILDLTGNIILGNYSQIQDRVQIFTHKHKWNHSRGLKKDIQKIIAVNLVIGIDAYIGVNAIILGVSKIGNGAVVGAGAVLTKDVPAYEIWAGNPAKKIGERKDIS